MGTPGIIWDHLWSIREWKRLSENAANKGDNLACLRAFYFEKSGELLISAFLNGFFGNVLRVGDREVISLE